MVEPMVHMFFSIQLIYVIDIAMFNFEEYMFG